MARNLNPSINFKFYKETIDGKRIVLVEIPAADSIPTSFNDKRYIRIDSSKANISKYPEREKELFKVLTVGYPTIINTVSKYQKLTFNIQKGTEYLDGTVAPNFNRPGGGYQYYVHK